MIIEGCSSEAEAELFVRLAVSASCGDDVNRVVPSWAFGSAAVAPTIVVPFPATKSFVPPAEDGFETVDGLLGPLWLLLPCAQLDGTSSETIAKKITQQPRTFMFITRCRDLLGFLFKGYGI